MDWTGSFLTLKFYTQLTTHKWRRNRAFLSTRDPIICSKQKVPLILLPERRPLHSRASFRSQSLGHTSHGRSMDEARRRHAGAGVAAHRRRRLPLRLHLVLLLRLRGDVLGHLLRDAEYVL